MEYVHEFVPVDEGRPCICDDVTTIAGVLQCPYCGEEIVMGGIMDHDARHLLECHEDMGFHDPPLADEWDDFFMRYVLCSSHVCQNGEPVKCVIAQGDCS